MRGERLRFHGRIAGVGTASGVRLVVGVWDDGPWGPFADVMVATAAGRRVLLAPDQRVADFVAATYSFDEVRLEPVSARLAHDRLVVRTPSLALEAGLGGRTPLGVLLRGVPASLGRAPWFCAMTDPVARVALRGVRTRGSAGGGRREWYGATDVHAVTSVAGTFDGVPLGALGPVDPPPDFGFSSTPLRPSITSVTTTVELPGGQRLR